MNIEWVDVQHLFTTILAIIAIFMAIYGFAEAIKKLRKPSDDLRRMVEEHEERLAEGDERMNNIEETQKIILSGVLAIIDHEITGNSVDRLKEVKTHIQTYLVEKK